MITLEGREYVPVGLNMLPKNEIINHEWNWNTTYISPPHCISFTQLHRPPRTSSTPQPPPPSPSNQITPGKERNTRPETKTKKHQNGVSIKGLSRKVLNHVSSSAFLSPNQITNRHLHCLRRPYPSEEIHA